MQLNYSRGQGIILGTLSIFVSVHHRCIWIFLPWNLLFLGLCYVLSSLIGYLWTMTTWYITVALSPNLTCITKMYIKKESSIVFLGYQQKASDVSVSLARIPFVLFNFCFKRLIWSLKSKCLSLKTPSTRYLVQVFCLILKHSNGCSFF